MVGCVLITTVGSVLIAWAGRHGSSSDSSCTTMAFSRLLLRWLLTSSMGVLHNVSGVDGTQCCQGYTAYTMLCSLRCAVRASQFQRTQGGS